MQVKRHLRVVFSRQESGESGYTEIARGKWMLGREPELSGEPIPPEVLTGLEKQVLRHCEEPGGTVTFDRNEVRYAMDFEVVL